MCVLICPINRAECHKHIIPKPKSVFIITNLPDQRKPDASELEVTKIIKLVKNLFRERGFGAFTSTDIKESGSNLCKVCSNIMAMPVSVVIYAKDSKKKSIPNIFYETGLLHASGNEPILIKNKQLGYPSDLKDIDWERYGDMRELKELLKEKIDKITELPEFYIRLAENEEEEDIQKTIYYYKRSYLLSENEKPREKLKEILVRLKEYEHTLITKTVIDDLKKFLNFTGGKELKKTDVKEVSQKIYTLINSRYSGEIIRSSIYFPNTDYKLALTNLNPHNGSGVFAIIKGRAIIQYFESFRIFKDHYIEKELFSRYLVKIHEVDALNGLIKISFKLS